MRPIAHHLGSLVLAGAAIALALAAALSISSAPCAAQAAPAAPAEWIQKSNAHSQVLLQVFGKLAPEQAGMIGVEGLDAEVMDLKPGFIDRQKQLGMEALTELKKRLAAEQDPRVRQDLEILIDRAQQGQDEFELQLKYNVPYFSVSQTVYNGIKTLLDDRVPAERRQHALARLEKYAGVTKGYEPIAELAEARIRERMDANKLWPVKDEVQRELNNGPTYVKGIAELFEKYKIKGYKKAYGNLQKQLAKYDAFVTAEILPKARTDFRQPEELYQFALKRFGNDMPVDVMVSRAQVAFKELQNQMNSIAPLVAKERGFKSTDYRDVIRELKKEQLVGEAILPHYQARLKEVEQIIRDQKLLTLPTREAQIKLASEAESARTPAPHVSPPRFIGNTGEQAWFMLPLRIPDAQGNLKGFDDFTFAAASWTLTAHEARPGHELQFAKMIENGVSLARGLFSLNSVNVEGWGLYAEAELQPYEPVEGQLIALQHRLMRAARAILDPGLQLGTITREEAERVLRDDVVLSDAMVQQEVERYMWWAPGQAPSYFVGYCELMEMRAMAERTLGPRFDRMKFHDFVLAQGLLPIKMLRKTVTDEFIPQQLATN
jgi:uncharacterized protein (DUF885 family)